MNKTRCDIYLSADVYFKILSKGKELNLKSVSQVIEKCLREYFLGETEHEQVIGNFHKTIGVYEERIRNLEHELRSGKKK